MADIGDDSYVQNEQLIKQKQALRRRKSYGPMRFQKAQGIKKVATPLEAVKENLEASVAKTSSGDSSVHEDSTLHDEEWVKQQQALRRRKSQLPMTFQRSQGMKTSTPLAPLKENLANIERNSQGDTRESSGQEEESTIHNEQWQKQQQALRRRPSNRNALNVQSKDIVTSTPMVRDIGFGLSTVQNYFQGASPEHGRGHGETNVSVQEAAATVGLKELANDDPAECAVPQPDESTIPDAANDIAGHSNGNSVTKTTEGATKTTEGATVPNTEQTNVTGSCDNSVSDAGKDECSDDEADDGHSDTDDGHSDADESTIPNPAEGTIPEEVAGLPEGEATQPDESAVDVATPTGTAAVRAVVKKNAPTMNESAAQDLPRRSARQPKPKVVCRMCDDNGHHYY